uniref:Uncharacterized protein n=1 Tax=Oncorhynchus mykiss TaxID=8022 RepID=A0A8C7R885_ONCMY
MLLVSCDKHMEYLGFLPEVDSVVVCEFQRIKVEFLRKGTNAKLYEGAASKYQFPSFHKPSYKTSYPCNGVILFHCPTIFTL